MVLVTELENSLWGTVLNGKNHCEHKSERAVHVTMAALDTTSTYDQYVPVMVQRGDNSYILCTLHAPNCLQQTLDLEVNRGETVNFYVNGNGVVHLTGYYIQEEVLDDMDQEGGHELMDYGHENCDDEECGGHGGHNGFGEFDDSDDDDDDDDEEGDEDDDDEDDDISGDEFGEEDDDDDEEDEDEDEEQKEEDNKPNGKKRKLETKNKELKKQSKDAKKPKKQESEDEDEEEEEDEPPKLVKSNQKQQKNNNDNKNNTKKDKNSQNKEADTTKNVNGVEIKDVIIGKGPEAKKGKYVHVYYQGKLKQNGKQFDACQSGKPFKFRLGSGEVIKGWDIGVNGMKVGSKRILTIPPNLAYGNQKLGGIPPNSTLVFEVELKAVS